MNNKPGSREKCKTCEHGDIQHKDPYSDRTTNRTRKLKVSLISRLNRVEGQVRGIRGMIEKDVYCDDVLNQIFAVQSAMKSVGMLLLEQHVKTCIVRGIQTGEMELLDEMLMTIEKLVK